MPMLLNNGSSSIWFAHSDLLLAANQFFFLNLINSAEAEKPTNISSSMMNVFQRGLLSQKDDGEPPKLTESGFQFLERGLDTAELMSFLLELSFRVTGQRNIIKDLHDLGLVKLQQGMKESWFIPTKLITNLSISLTDSSSKKTGICSCGNKFSLLCIFKV